ncbi:cell death abnormality protein 1-like [Magallana gigas]|uniref:cell death abnormality protein 1-like n=1 Tax=Magallana gigas TaxID=29159 RepID=UPI0033425038
MYGESCLEKCDCQSHQECNYIHGCIDSFGICSNKESDDIICCDNFILTNGHCKACPLGTFRTNCSLECPDGFYGMFCKEKCDCKTSECDKAVGCPKKDTWGICSNKESPGVVCCDNFILSNGNCKACPSGTFWTNCSLECPDGYYGIFCKEKCDCKTSECDKAVGCPKKDSPDLPLTTSIITIVAVSLAITSVVIGVTICVIIKYKSRQQSVYIAALSSLNEESIGLSRLRENYYSSLIKKSPN